MTRFTSPMLVGMNGVNGYALIFCVGLMTGLAAGCKKKQPRVRQAPVPIAALAAIPVDATVVIGVDVGRLADSPLVARAIEQMLLRDPDLSARLARLAGDCGVDLPRQARSVHLALGPKLIGGSAQPSLLVATGEFSEPTLIRCLQAGVGSGGATLVVKEAADRPLYALTEGSRTLFFGFGKADTVVIGPSEAWVRTSLSGESKIDLSPTLGGLLRAIDRTAAIWAVAVMDADLGASLAKITQGKIASPPGALYGALDVTDGIRAEISFVMNNVGDAEALAGFAQGELALLALAAQAKGLGSLVAKATVESKGPETRFRVQLNDTELKQLLGAIDRGRAAGQDAQPVPDAGPSPSLPDLGGAEPPKTL